MLEYLARRQLAVLDMRTYVRDPEWYLDLVVSTWFPGWETAWLANHYLWVRWRGHWLYVIYEQREAPYRVCEIRLCPHHPEAVITRSVDGGELEHGRPKNNGRSWSWSRGYCNPNYP
jgi:hypothetical protein